jgi:hypothetical protein
MRMPAECRQIAPWALVLLGLIGLSWSEDSDHKSDHNRDTRSGSGYVLGVSRFVIAAFARSGSLL